MFILRSSLENEILTARFRQFDSELKLTPDKFIVGCWNIYFLITNGLRKEQYRLPRHRPGPYFPRTSRPPPKERPGATR